MGQENASVARFRDYLRIKTVHPDPNYDEALDFLSAVAEDLGLHLNRVLLNSCPRREVGIVTWEGTQPFLPSLMLNSHMDVVTVAADEWKYDPFLAHKDESGNIFARGAQDMKCVGIQYLEAIRKLKFKGKRFPRTVHLTFVPDEEVGGPWGMLNFVKHEEFKAMNVGFALDEGIASPTPVFSVFYGERQPFSIDICCHGNPGHGSKFVSDSAAVKFTKVLQEINAFREVEIEKLESNPELMEGDVTTVNVTIVQGGDLANVVPSKISLTCDVRVPPGTTQDSVENMAAKWCEAAGKVVTYQVTNRGSLTTDCASDLTAARFLMVGVTSTDVNNPWWKAFTSACEMSCIEIKPAIFPASTDSTYLRQLGIPALGFSPMNNTPVLLHGNNEYLNEKVFLCGIDIYQNVISTLATMIAS